MYLREIRWDGIEWIDLAKCMGTIMKLRVP
jgi:hypothetical protein